MRFSILATPKLAVRWAAGCVCSCALLASGTLGAELPTLRFDLGGSAGPVADGFQAVRATETYSPRRGYGWLSTNQEDFLVRQPVT